MNWIVPLSACAGCMAAGFWLGLGIANDRHGVRNRRIARVVRWLRTQPADWALPHLDEVAADLEGT